MIIQTSVAMGSEAKARLRRLLTGTGTIRLMLVLLAVPSVLLGAVAAAALACALAPLALIGLSIKSLLRPARGHALHSYPDL